MRKLRSRAFFQKPVTSDFEIKDLTGELENSSADFDIEDNQLSAGQNIMPISDSSMGKRDGINLYNNFLGSGVGIDGGWSFYGANGTQEQVVAWNGKFYHLVGSTWTALTGASYTAGTACDGVYFADTNKFYITNGTDTVVKYQAGQTSADQTDTNFPKGKYITTFQGRLIVANISGTPNQVDYSSAQVDTFPANYFFVLPGEFNIAVTALVNFNNLILMVFSRRRIFSIQNFTFDGTNAWVSQIYEVPSDFGSIAERTIAVVQNFVYFLGQDMSNTAAVYKTDGYTCFNISFKKVRTLTKTLNASNISKACAVADSVFYRLYMADDSQSENTSSIIYDASKDIFLPAENRFVKGIADFATLWSAEISGVWQVFGGTQGTGQVYKLHGNSGLYDELPEEAYNATAASSQATSITINANPATRGAESFKLGSYNSSQTISLTQALVYIETNGGTSTDLTLRIETDSSGKPSGTLVTNGSATIAASGVAASYGWQQVAFTTPPKLSGNTTYWLVLKHVTEGSGNSSYKWLGNTAGTYSRGNAASYASSTWTANTNNQVFILYLQSAIDGYFDSKAFLPVKGREFSLKKMEMVFSGLSANTTNMLIGFASDSFASFKTYALTVQSTGNNIFGNTASGGSNIKYGSVASGGAGAIYGNRSRQFTWMSIDNFYGRTLKLRVRNNQPNQQFEMNKAMLILAPRDRDA